MKQIIKEYSTLKSNDKVKLYISILTGEKLLPGESLQTSENKFEKIKGINAGNLRSFLREEKTDDGAKVALFKAFHEAEGDDNYVSLLLSAFQSIPEELLSTKNKAEINKKIAGHCLERMSDLSFDDPLPALTRKPRVKQTPITIREYKCALSCRFGYGRVYYFGIRFCAF